MAHVNTLQYVLDSFFTLIFSVLVLMMYLGFALFNAGSIRTKNNVTILVKHVAGFAIVCLTYLLLSQHIIYQNVKKLDSFFSYVTAIFLPSQQSLANVLLHTNHSIVATVFFHMLLPCITVAIVISGTAERLKFWAFVLIALLLVAFIYPIEAYWVWGKGFLHHLGFIDHAGAGVIYLAGAIFGLTGTLILGPRQGKFHKKATINLFHASNIPLATMGLLLIWFGALGFNAGVHYVGEEVINVNTLAIIFLNTLAAPAAGLMTTLILTRIFYGSTDITFVANGIFAALAAIAASPAYPTLSLTLLVGSVAGLLVVLTVNLLEKCKVDDPTGSIAAFSGGSIWGLLAYALMAESFGGQLLIQALGIGVIIGWVGVTSALSWYLIKFIIGIRIKTEDEIRGLDVFDCAMSAYPEFTRL